jgi:hypothetical protein
MDIIKENSEITNHLIDKREYNDFIEYNITPLIIMKLYLSNTRAYVGQINYFESPVYSYSKEEITYYKDYQRVINQMYSKDKKISFAHQSLIKILLINHDNLDLLTKYLIYKERDCEQIRPGYAKMKILNELDLYYEQIQKDNYLSLQTLNMYLRNNCQMFGLKNTKPLFMLNDVYLDENLQITHSDIPNTSPEQIIKIANNVNNEMYKNLRNIILSFP